MITLIKKGLKILFYSDSSSEIEFVKKATSFFVPGAEFSSKFQDGYWDGTYKFYTPASKRFKRGDSFWFGLLNYVVKRLDREGVRYSIEGFEDRDVSWVTFGDKFLSDERNYQKEAILKTLTRGYGIIKVPTRGGKTYIASEMIRLLLDRNPGHKFLFLVDSAEIYRQAIGDIAGVVGLPEEEIGQIRGQKFDLKAINVGMIQTIQSGLKRRKPDTTEHRRRRETFTKFLKELNVLFVDEIQEFGESQPRIKVIRRCVDVDYIVGLSATPYKESGEIAKITIESLTGGVVYEIEEAELVDAGVLVRNKILLLLMKHKMYGSHLGLSYFSLFDKVILENFHRNEMLKAVIDACYKLSLKTLVLFSSVKHGKMLSKDMGFEFAWGDYKDEDRDRVKEEFLDGKGKVLFASGIWKKGITLPEVEVLINADGGKEQSLVIQRRGRVLGISEGKTKALAIDFVDDYDRYFNKHSLERIRAYEKKVGKEGIDVLDTDDVDFIDQLEDYLVDWFELNIVNE